MIQECLILWLEQFLSGVLSDVSFIQFSIERWMSLFSSVYFSVHSLQAQSSSHPSHPSFLNKRRKVPRTPVPVPRPVQALLAFNPGASAPAGGDGLHLACIRPIIGPINGSWQA